mmetsp:Transcript_8488/g.16915  ORF Transcript_8488/g.16915 Transcript_8488/m.16915 type:complete len:103 (+) Transcript_8488:946-1254(+)
MSERVPLNMSIYAPPPPRHSFVHPSQLFSTFSPLLGMVSSALLLFSRRRRGKAPYTPLLPPGRLSLAPPPSILCVTWQSLWARLWRSFATAAEDDAAEQEEG